MKFLRTEILLGKENVEKLKKSKVMVFGIGGVGSYVVEALVRSGVGNLILVDNDTVDVTNINRQIIATTKTVGRVKAEVAKERVLEINPDCNVEVRTEFFLPETRQDFIDNDVDYIVDAIDTVTAKIELAKRAQETGIKIMSSLGTGKKLNPMMFEVTDIKKTSVCPLAKVMRRELKNRGIKRLKVVYSKEEPTKCNYQDEDGNQIIGSVGFVPSVAGLIIASEVVKDLIR